MIALLATAMQWLLNLYLDFAGPLAALALLSLTTFVLMLPLYRLGDALLRREKQRKALMQDELDSIQNVQSAARKYFYTREIYRRYGYHPLQSLVGLLGLAVQIPFFLAAYRMLHDYRGFDGLASGIFADLAQPDQLLLIWDFPLNLLPLFMTAINILSAYFYSAGEPRRDKLQLLLFPGIFLLLLYRQPAALVFYWSMNNVCSLIKNVYLARKQGVRFSGGARYRGRRLCALFDAGQLEHWGQGHSKLFFAAAVFAAFLSLFYIGYTGRERSVTTMFYQLGAATLLLLYLTLLLRYIRYAISAKRQRDPKPASRISRRELGACLILLATLVALAVSVYCQLAYNQALRGELESQFVWRSRMLLSRFVLLATLWAAIVLQLCALPEPWKAKWVRYFLYAPRPRSFPRFWSWGQVGKTALFARYVLSVLALVSAVALSSPIRTASSDPAQFSGGYLRLFVWLLAASLLSVAVLTLLYFLLPYWLKYYATFFSSVFALFVSANVLFFPGDYGAMEFTSFKNPLEIGNQDIALSLLFLLAVILLLVFRFPVVGGPQRGMPRLSERFTCNSHYPVLSWILALELLLIVRYSWLTYRDIQLLAQGQASVTAETTGATPIQLSRSKTNVIIVVLDKFIGGYVPAILQASPQLAERLDGFVYFPNTVSQSNASYGGIHPIVGGAEYTIDKMNANERHLASDIVDAFTMIPRALAPLDFDSTFIDLKPSIVTNANATFRQRLRKYGVHDYHSALNYDLLADPKLARQAPELRLAWPRFLLLVGLFQGLGPVFRQKIYSQGRWLHAIGNRNGWAAMEFFDPYLKLLNLRTLTALREDDKSSYILIHNNLPHNATFAQAYDYYANPAYFAHPLPPPPEEFVRFDQQHDPEIKGIQAQFYANYHSLYLIADWLDWLDWLQQQGVYDNSIIYLVSDHGGSNFDPSFGQQKGDWLRVKAAFHSLYMRKMHGSRGTLRRSQEFRTTADIPAEFLPSLGVSQNPYSGKKLRAVQTQPLPLYIIPGTGQNEILAKNYTKYYIRQQFWLKNRNIFQDRNWEKSP